MNPNIIINSSILTEISTLGIYEVESTYRHVDRKQSINCMLLVLEGDVFVCEGEEDYHIKKGEVFFLKHGIRHFGKHIMPIGTKWIWMSFWPYDTNNSEDILILPKKLKIQDMSGLTNMMMSLHDLFTSNEPLKSQRLRSGVHEILLKVASEGQYSKHTYKDSPITKQIKDTLREQITQPFDASLIEEALQMNYSYLGRVFKKETGMTLNKYFTEIKIKKAIDWMHYRNYNVSQISDSLGFANPYYFSRVFKKVTGMSPRAYMKQLYR